MYKHAHKKLRRSAILPWWPSWLVSAALINVDAPGCGTSVVRGPTGHKYKGFHPNRVLIKEAILV